MKHFLLALICTFACISGRSTVLSAEWTATSGWTTASGGQQISFPLGDVYIYSIQGAAKNPPVVNTNYGDVRIYSQGELIVRTLSGADINKITFHLSAQGLRRLGTLSVNTGEIEVDLPNSLLTWTGSAPEVAFTVPDYADLGTDGATKAAQFAFNSPIEIQMGDPAPPIDPNTVIPIAEAQKAKPGQTVKVQGTICATGLSGFLIGDGSGFIYYYNPLAGETYKQGDIITISGPLSTYGGFNQFVEGALITGNGHLLPEHGKPVKLSGSDIDNWVNNPEIKFVEVVGTFAMSGSYYNLSFDGATAIGSLGYSSKALLNTLDEGKTYRVRGYAFMVTGNSRFINFIATDIAEEGTATPVADKMEPEIPVGAVCLNFTDNASAPAEGTPFSSFSLNGINLSLSNPAAVAMGDSYRALHIPAGYSFTVTSANGNPFHSITFGLSDNSRLTAADGTEISKYRPVWTGNAVEQTFTASADTEVFYLILDYSDSNADIQEGAGFRLTAVLPGETPDARLKGKFLVIENTSLHTTKSMAVEAGARYVMSNLADGSEISVYFTDASGVRISNPVAATIKGANITLSLAVTDLPAFAGLKAVVSTPDGKDISSQCSFTWLTPEGATVSDRQDFADAVAGSRYLLRCSASKPLNHSLSLPDEIAVTAGETAIIAIEATPIADLTLKAIIVDNLTGSPVPTAEVTVVQTYADGSQSRAASRSDSNGAISIPLKGIPAIATISKSDYCDTSLEITLEDIARAIAAGNGVLDMEAVRLRPIQGTVINLNIALKNSEGQITENYSDARSLEYIVAESSSGKILESALQFPRLTVVGYDSNGGTLRVTACSPQDLYAPATAECTPSGGEASLSLTIVERGDIVVSAESLPEGSVYAIAYDSEGNRVANAPFADGSARIHALPEGTYRIVALQTENPDVWTHLTMLAEAGIPVGTGYAVTSEISVVDGATASAAFASVPAFDFASISFTGSATAVGLNKTIATVGNIVTATAYIDFKEEYASKISGLRLKAALPEGVEFKENSVMVGSSPSSYEYNASTRTVEIPLSANCGKIRFCISAVSGGEKSMAVVADFSLDGRRISSPIGVVNLTARDLNLNVPACITDGNLSASGECKPDADVTIFDNGSRIGSAKSNAIGYWSGNFVLPDAYNGSVHSIQAKVDDPDGGPQLASKAVDVKIDRNHIFATKVTMTNTDHSGRELREQSTVFNLQDHRIEGNAYYRFWPAYPDFNFEIELNDNTADAAQAVFLKVYTTKDEWRGFYAEYNATLGLWTAKGTFKASELPVGVKVNVLSESKPEADRMMLDDLDAEFSMLMADYWSNRNSDADDYEPIHSSDADEYPDEMTVDELTAVVDEMERRLDAEKEFINSLDDMFAATIEDNPELAARSGVTILDYEDHPADFWLRAGYRAIDVTDGSQMFVRTVDSTVDVVDTGARQHWQYDLSAGESSPLRVLAAASEAQSDDNNSTYSKIYEVIKSIYDTIDKINSCIDNVESLYTDVLRKCSSLEEFFENTIKNHDSSIEAYTTLVKKQEKWIADLQDQLAKAPDELERVVIELEIERRQKILSRSKNTLKGFKSAAKTTRASLKNLKFLRGKIGKVMPLAKYFIMIADGISSLKDMLKLLQQIPQSCDCDPDGLTKLQLEGVAYAISRIHYVELKIVIEAVNDLSSVAMMIPSGGTALPLVALKQIIKKIVIDLAIDFTAEQGFKGWQHSMFRRINELKKHCKKPCDDDDDDDDDDPHTIFHCDCNSLYGCTCYSFTCLCSNCDDLPEPLADPIQDPSGFVYEGSESQRIEGVTATLYQKTISEDSMGDFQEVVAVWDAARYGQSNPVITDAEGYYRWDVPEGLWQVKFEKEGYETVTTDWLPVPPPQLDVNIAMKHLVAPSVVTASATPTAVIIDFSKFMLCPTANTSRIFVKQNGSILRGRIEYPDYQKNGNGEVASKVTFIPESVIESPQVEVLVSKDVESYAGIPMSSDYIATIDVRPVLSAISVEQSFETKIGDVLEIEVSAVPAAAGEGIAITAVSTSPSVVPVEPAIAYTDADGKARFSVSARMAGTARILFKTIGSGFEAIADVTATPAILGRVSRPVASVSTDLPVDAGTEVYLGCSTKGASILYTTDGSDPTELSDNVTLYDGLPIRIEHDMVIRAVAMADNMTDSEVVSFRFIVSTSGVENVAVETSEISVSPIPMRDMINIQTRGRSILGVHIFDMRGARLISRNFSTHPSEVSVETTTLPKGIYLIVVETDFGKSCLRTIKV